MDIRTVVKILMGAAPKMGVTPNTFPPLPAARSILENTARIRQGATPQDMMNLGGIGGVVGGSAAANYLFPTDPEKLNAQSWAAELRKLPPDQKFWAY